ncbi:MAG: C40 family peptidase [Burkholderiales bacterium]
MTSRVLLFVFALLFSGAVQADDAGQTYAAEGEALLKGLPDSVRGLLGYAVSQAGVAYRRGGTSPEAGFDCSGFVRYVFDHVEGLSLPHSAKAMSLIGNRIKLAELKPGDLVFFRIMRHGISHVGIYLGDNRFIHAASTSTESVVISDLAESYWARRLTLARRIVLPAETSSNISE